MHAATKMTTTGSIALVLAIAMGGCGKIKQNDQREVGTARAEAKRNKAACASSAAYGRLKGLLFDQAIAQHEGDRANLDTLADYSSARMEDPVVEGWDAELDITRCKGRFILELPPGAERAFGGERRIQTDLRYTAQASADGNGFVYKVQGAEPIVTRLAAFNLKSGAYRPPPAIDEGLAGSNVPEPTAMAQADVTAPAREAVREPVREPGRDVTERADARAPEQRRSLPPRQPTAAPRRDVEVASYDREERAEREEREPAFVERDGEGTVRAFYAALGAGNGAGASAQVIPEKRSSGAYSPAAMSRFYGGLPEPIRLTSVQPLAGGAYRVSYRYAAGRSRCNGSAVVRLTNRGGRDLIRSIQALNGC